MNIQKAFDNAFQRATDKNWDYIYVMIDVHGTILKPSYNTKEKYEFYPYAKEVLQFLTNNTNIKLILWTSSTETASKNYIDICYKNNIIFNYINSNPEVKREPNDPITLDLSKKFYFNVGIDDKFGFEPETDWEDIYNYLINKIKHVD